MMHHSTVICRFAIAAFAFNSACVVRAAQGKSIDKSDPEPIALKLIPTDLSQANIFMTRYDRNDDSYIDRDEQARLGWDDDSIRRFDVNRDGKLTHVEVALWHAATRAVDGIEEADSKFAEKNLLRHDTNKNGRLDPDEIERSGWPLDVEEFDKDSDGSITLRELMVEFAFRRGLKRQLGIASIDSNGANRLIREHDKFPKDGKLSKQESEAAELEIEDADQDGDGTLDSIEVATILARRRMKGNLSPAAQYHARNMFRMFDTDQDGSLSADEFKKIKGFDLNLADANRDNRVSKLELETVLSEQRRQSGITDKDRAIARRFVLRYDEDRDGVLSESEFTDASKDGGIGSEFSKIDSDTDKKLTAVELAKSIAGKRESK